MPDSAPAPAPTRCTVEFPQSALDDLRERLARTRWADEPPLPPWSTGTSLAYLRELVDHWQHRFDWRTHEARLNAFAQYRLAIDDIDLYFIHEPGRGPRPMPLLLSHGWPGSVLEFAELIPRLTDPARYGGDPRDAFTVVAPALPGYPLSYRPGQKRFALEAISTLFARLMTEVLGYARFGAQGGDWGSFVTSRLAVDVPERMIGIHLNLLPLRRDPKSLDSPTPEEQRYRTELEHWLREETGYQWIQGTRPTTLAFALSDSPVGLAAWIVEKFRQWTDCGGEPERAVGRDDILADVTLYWLTGAIGASFWPYYARMHGPWPIPEERPIAVPTGYVQFPHEILRPPRSLASRVYADIRRWTEMPRGGHFAALEQPEALADEIREFFRPLR